MTLTAIFITTTIIFTIVGGGFFSAIYYCNVEDKSNVKGKSIKAVAIALLVGLIIGGALTLDEAINREKWNNGKCTNCEMEWEPNGASKARNGKTTFFYYCPNCQKNIEINH